MQDPGPWYIANLAPNGRNGESIYIVHTFAEHFAFIYSILKPSEQLIMLELIGPFGKRVEAEKIASLLRCKIESKIICDEFKLNRWEFNELIRVPDESELSTLSLKKIKSLK